MGNGAEFSHQDGLISVTSFSLKFDEGDFAWSGTLVIGDYDDYARIKKEDPIEIHIGGEIYKFIVDSKRRSLNEPASISMEISVVSPTAIYDIPRFIPISKTWTEPVMASEAAQEFLPVPMDWGTVDWLIPAFRLGVEDISVISLISMLAEAVAATVETTREGDLYVRPLYKHTTEFFYEDASIDHTLDDATDIFTVEERYDTSVLANRIDILDVEVSYADFMEWNPDEGSATEGELKAFPSPYRPFHRAPVVTTSPTDVVGLIPVEEILWEVEEPELIEIYEGTGRTRYPIHEIVEIFWESIPLPGIAFEFGANTVQSTSGEDDYGLLRLTYRTRYHSYRVSGTVDRAGQFLMMDTSEE